MLPHLHSNSHSLIICHVDAKRSFRLMNEAIAGQKLTRQEHEELYTRHIQPGTLISAENATTYTCPLYACLLSLVLALDSQRLANKRILAFSYGSGCAASMFGIRVKHKPVHPKDLLDYLRGRVPKPLDKALPLIDAFENTHGRFGFVPSHQGDRQAGAYYLQSVDAMGRRKYAKHAGGLAVIKDPDSIITRIKLMQEAFDGNMIDGIIKSLEAGRVHIFTSDCKNFCVGASAAGVINKKNFVDGLYCFKQLHNALIERCDLPTIVLCDGAT